MPFPFFENKSRLMRLDSLCSGFLSSLKSAKPDFISPNGCGARYFKRRKINVIKLDIINRLADETGVPKQKAEQVVDALFGAMKDSLVRGERIELRGFGVFTVKPRKRGVGRNPRTGEEVAIPIGKTIRFKPGKDLQPENDTKTAKRKK
jgi:DNA-binding protein HU-beta